MDAITFSALDANHKIYDALETDEVVTWCGGCGNYAIQNALKLALSLEGIKKDKVIFCFDVGCSGNGSDKIEAYTIHGLHGRVLPLAAGVKNARHDLHIIAEAGDGATFSEGVNHLVHAVRNDYPILFIHHNNENYGLTTGQPSSLTPKGCKMNCAPEGSPVDALDPLQFLMGLNPSFVARGCYADVDHLANVFCEALRHKGFAFVDVLQTCPTYNKHTPHEWYLNHTQDVSAIDGYDPTNKAKAMEVIESDDKWYTGVLYKNPEKVPFLESMGVDRKDKTLVDKVAPVTISNLVRNV